MKPCEIWIEQVEATRQIEAEFGTQNALDYLIGEKFLSFLQAAETDAEFRAEIPAFVGGIKTIFEPRPELVEDERQDDLCRCAADLLLVKQARGWLLDEDD
jgi:hypothetical protein